VAMVLAEVAAVFPLSPGRRSDVVAAEVAALTGWLGLAVVGHAHKIVPFIGYSALRARGIRTRPDGSPLLFAHLFRPTIARITLALIGAGFGLVVVGLLAVSAPLVAVGGVALASGGATATANLGLTPRRVVKEATP
jgi:hypothetical protein